MPSTGQPEHRDFSHRLPRLTKRFIYRLVRLTGLRNRWLQCLRIVSSSYRFLTARVASTDVHVLGRTQREDQEGFGLGQLLH